MKRMCPNSVAMHVQADSGEWVDTPPEAINPDASIRDLARWAFENGRELRFQLVRVDQKKNGKPR